jgi:hypothetical protein
MHHFTMEQPKLSFLQQPSHLLWVYKGFCSNMKAVVLILRPNLDLHTNTVQQRKLKENAMHQLLVLCSSLYFTSHEIILSAMITFQTSAARKLCFCERVRYR